MSFLALSKTFTGEFSVQAPVERVFPLFSPLGEREWVPEWAPEMIFPAGAEWAEEMIFRTLEETGEAVWIVTRLDLTGKHVAYHRVEPGRYVARVEVRCKPLSSQRTLVRTAYRFVGLSEGGNQEIEAMTQEAYDAKMRRWSGWIAGAIERGASG